MDLFSRVSSLLNTLSSTCLMPLISLFYTGWLTPTPGNIMVVVVITAAIFMSPLLCFKHTADDQLNSEIDSIENVNHQFLPVYLGYFFVTFSITDFYWFMIIYAVIVILLSCSRLMYFNILLLCTGYSFYKVHTVNGISCYIISKRFITRDGVSFSDLKRLNNMTFVEYHK